MNHDIITQDMMHIRAFNKALKECRDDIAVKYLGKKFLIGTAVAEIVNIFTQGSSPSLYVGFKWISGATGSSSMLFKKLLEVEFIE